MSRTTDQDDSVSDEIKKCNAINQDLTIQIYSGKGDGFEEFYHYKESISKDLTECVEDEVKKNRTKFKGQQDKIKFQRKRLLCLYERNNLPRSNLRGIFVDNDTDIKIVDTI